MCQKEIRKPTLRVFVMLLLGGGLCFGVSGSAWATDLYVNNVFGDDRANGQSPVFIESSIGPVRTMGRALRLAGPGVVIRLAKTGVEYAEESAVCNVQGADGLPITVEGQGAVFSGLAKPSDRLWEYAGQGHYLLKEPYRQRVAVVADGDVQRVRSFFGISRPNLDDHAFALWKGELLVRFADKKTPAEHKVRVSQLDVALMLHEIEHLVFRDITFQGFAVDGVQIRGNAKGVQFERCTFQDNGRLGAFVTNAASVSFADCRFARNGVASVKAVHVSQVTFQGAPPEGILLDASSRKVEKELAVAPTPSKLAPAETAEKPNESEPSAPAPKTEKPKARPSFFKED